MENIDELRQLISAHAEHVRDEVHSSSQRQCSDSLLLMDFTGHVCTDGQGVEATNRSQLPIRCSSVASGSSGFLQYHPRMPRLGLVEYDQRMPAQETVRESSGGLFQPSLYSPGRAALPERTGPPPRLRQDVTQHEAGSIVNRPATSASRLEGTSSFSTCQLQALPRQLLATCLHLSNARFA
eukprot:scpid75757/ scgid35769/ 